MSDGKSFPRLFTVEEANDLLPAIHPLMDRISESVALLRERSERVIREERLSPDSPELMERLKRDDSIAGIIREVQELVDKVNSLGCVCKGVEEGLVDFPCQFGEEIVFLCWRQGERSVEHWHRIEDGFAGRKPLLDPEGAGGNPETYH
ncbi:MAG: DUF2203 domain-containing protein [Candidatus Binatia bacterium]